jgi:molybdopterin molybdotransferase
MDIRTKGFHKRTPVDRALEILLGRIRPLVPEKVPLEGAGGRVLSGDITAGMDSPPFNRSAMDGYAVRGRDTFGASPTNPIYFRILGEVRMGTLPDMRVGEFEAVRIMTGGPMPEGADAVVIFEHTNEIQGGIEVLKAVTPGKNVGLKGEDVRKGDRLFKKGRQLRPQDVGVLASMGIREVEVYRRPRVAVISTGDELLEPGEEPVPGRIYNSNTYSIVSMVRLYGGVPDAAPLVRDDYGAMRSAIQSALEGDADMVILTGATSVGKRDVIPKIVGDLGEVLVHGVAMRPGEPTGFGIASGKPVFMLPGYPVAAMVGFMTFAGPAIQTMQGLEPENPLCKRKAVLGRKIPSELGRRDFTRVRVVERDGTHYAEPIRTRGSGILMSMVKADGFVVVPENTEGVEEGEEMEVYLY